MDFIVVQNKEDWLKGGLLKGDQGALYICEVQFDKLHGNPERIRYDS
jgi:hypothetical protein